MVLLITGLIADPILIALLNLELYSDSEGMTVTQREAVISSMLFSLRKYKVKYIGF